MIWIAPSEKDADADTRISSLSASQGGRARVRCWPSGAADQFRANSGLKSQEYSGGCPKGPVLGIILLRFAEVRFAAQPEMDEAGLLAFIIQNLRRTRDLLQPRLLSGQISLTTEENYANA